MSVEAAGILRNLEDWSLKRRAALLAALWVCALGACVVEAALAGGIRSAFFLLLVPAAAAVHLFGPGLLAAVVGVTAVPCLFGFFPLVQGRGSAALLAAFLAVLGWNARIWIRRRREESEGEFQLQKEVDSLKEARVDLEMEYDKVRSSYQANRVKIQRYRALNELARSLAMTFRVPDVAGLLVETVSKTFLAPRGVYTLVLFEGSLGKALHVVRYAVDTELENRLDRERLSPEEPFNAWAVSHRRALLSSDLVGDFRFQWYAARRQKHGSLAVAPLVAGEEVVGVLRLESPEAGTFRQDDVRLLSIFADMGTVALEHAALYRQTIEMAITDGLTGLYVQRYYKERLRDEMNRALEHRLPLCLMMLDVDNFKSYNDTYGHLVGDQVLRRIAEVLRDSVRAVDLVARYGGEEFSVLLPKTEAAGAFTVAERIRSQVEKLRIPVGDQVTTVTVSLGLAELDPLSVRDVEAFLDRADQALYQAKRTGKNRVVCWAPPRTGTSK